MIPGKINTKAAERHNAMAGTSTVALLARMGVGVPTIDAEGNVKIDPAKLELANRILRPSGKTREIIRQEVAACLSATAEIGDQGFALQIIDEMLAARKAGIMAPESERLLFIHGGGGVGKTELMALTVKRAVEAQVGVITVVAPTNRAVKVLAKRIKAIAGDHPNLRVATAHSAFKQLALNSLGADLIEHFLAGAKGPLVSPLSNPATLSDVNDVYERFVASAKHWKKALAIAAKMREAEDVDTEKFAILRCIGFKDLDTRVTQWVDNISASDLVIVDEMSMVAAAIPRAALAGGSLVICSGDAAQLEPVTLEFSDARGVVLTDQPAIHMANSPNSVYLWQPRRTTEGSGIKLLSDFALSAPLLKDFVAFAAQIAADKAYPEVKHYSTIDKVPKADCEQGPVITYTNQTRNAFNRQIRAKLGFPEDRIVPGDRFFVSAINPHNKSMGGLVKDEFVVLTDIEDAAGDHTFRQFTFKDELGREIKVDGIALLDRQAKSERCVEYLETLAGKGDTGVTVPEDAYYASPSELILCPAFALTIHKSQGSEWDVVTFNLRSLNMDFLKTQDDKTPGLGGAVWKSWRRLAYTACSRARTQLNIIV